LALGAAALALLLVVAVVVVGPFHQGHKAGVVAGPPRNPYLGVGAWVDIFSWSDTYTGGAPRFGLSDIDAMARSGVQTLYIQAASQIGPAATLEPDRLLSLVNRAHHLGLSVVVWYQPTLVNVADDLTRLLAIGHLPADGVAVDIESTDVAAVAQRNASLVTLSADLRHALPKRPLGAIVLPATLLEVVNPAYWPAFPYLALAPLYDAWLPMVYWTDRLARSGFRDGERYTTDSVTRLRTDLGSTGSTTLINPIGGVSTDGLAPGDVSGFVIAAQQTKSVGGSLYEWPGTDPSDWQALRPLRS
jgi:hypothetical protein